MFDIVVFDEASQIRVADAVGAMGRGTSVVVVGDSKQMPPTSFAEVSTDIDADAEPRAEVVVRRGVDPHRVRAGAGAEQVAVVALPQPGRVAHHVQQSRLLREPAVVLPGAVARRSTLSDDDHGLSLVRVNGRFNRSGKGRDLRTNAVEAEAIVDEVSRRFAGSPDGLPSLGIITFNVQQRTLIETLLREAPDERIVQALDDRDGLFVKNLENVQGDERDVILFSVAFSENERGVDPAQLRAADSRRAESGD